MKTIAQDIQLDFDALIWYADGYALDTLVIKGVSFHVEVIEIVPCTKCFGDGVAANHWCPETEAVDPMRESQLQDIYAGFGNDGPWSTVEHNGRQFVILIQPYSA